MRVTNEVEVEFMKDRLSQMVAELDAGRMASLLEDLNKWSEDFPLS